MEILGGAEGLVSALERLDRVLRTRSTIGDLTAPGASALARIVREQPVRISDLARGERVSQPAMTQLIRRLEDSGYVSRADDPSDSRATLISATSSGAAVRAARHDERVAAFDRYIDALTAHEREAILAAVPALAKLASEAENDRTTTGTDRTNANATSAGSTKRINPQSTAYPRTTKTTKGSTR